MLPEYLWQIPILGAVVLLVGYGLYAANRRARAERAIEEARTESALARAREAGVIDEHERQLCAVCMHALATEHYPIITHHDRDLFGYRRLHGQGPLYGIEDASQDKLLCPAHKRMLERKLDELLAEVSARRAAFNSQVDQELAEWETGRLLVWAQTEATSARERLSELLKFTSPHKRLAAMAEQTPLPVASVSTVTLEPHEEES